jgi:hypothetical protein
MDHAVKIGNRLVLVGKKWEVEGDALRILDVLNPALVRLSNSDFSFATAPSSVVHTGVKSFGCEKRMTQLSPAYW